jgi:hypothetical protein
VKNATRAMVESTTAIKGLTGLDVPGLIGGAMGRGFGDRLRTGDGGDNGGGETAMSRINELAHEGLSTMPARAEQSAAHVEEKVAPTAAEAAADVKKVADAADKVAAQTKQAAVKAATVSAALGAAGAAKVAPSEGTIAQWAQWTADQLRHVPSIQLYGSIKLADLIDHGPPAAVAVWHTAQAAMGKDYGQMTVSDLLQRFSKSS